MAIEFLCPNGHQLTAGADRAGKPGKCPKCGCKFVVPLAAEVEGASVASQREETIAFLCPNGHELTGPARLQGRAGQCPHCGERFRIPVYDESDDEETSEPETVPEITVTHPPSAPPDPPSFFAPQDSKEDIPVGTFVDDHKASMEAPDVVVCREDAVEVGEDSNVEASPSRSAVIVVKQSPMFQHSLARAFFPLWSDRELQDTVELKLRDGETVQPAKFSAELSQHDHAVFAVTDEHGSLTIVALRWDDIVRIRFRKLQELPAGLFE